MVPPAGRVQRSSLTTPPETFCQQPESHASSEIPACGSPENAVHAAQTPRRIVSVRLTVHLLLLFPKGRQVVLNRPPQRVEIIPPLEYRHDGGDIPDESGEETE